MGHMKNYRQLLKELPSNKVVFAFGRFQPPTALHELQVKVVKRLAEQQRADYVIYASKDLKEELLPVDKKVHYMNLMFPNTNIETTDASTFVEAVKKLNKKYKNIVMVASADCKEDYEKILNKKNGSEFFFETIEVVAAGDKDPDENKLRESAKKGDYAKFKVALPSALREIDSRRLMNDMRQSLGLDMVKEEIKLVKDELRESYFRGEIFKVGEIVEADCQQYEIVKRGSNHLLLKEESGKLVSKWIQDVKLLEYHTRIEHNSDHKVLNHGADFKIKIHTKHHAKINGLEHGEQHEFKCMDGNEWGVQLRGDRLHFAAHKQDTGLSSNATFHIPAAQFAGTEEHKDEEKPAFITIFAKDMHEGVIQQSGTDDLDPPTVDTNSTYNIAKDVMRYKDFKKLNAMARGQVKEQEEKATEQVPYDEEPSEMEEFLKTITGTKETGHTFGSTDDNHRRRKVAYHLGEHIEKVKGGYEVESEHGNKNLGKSPTLAGAKKRLKQVEYFKHMGEEFTEDEVQLIGELSTELLARYKTASAADAKKSDSEGNYAKGDKRFKGINKATNKQFDNDLKKHGQYQKEETELSETAPFKTKEDAVKYAKEKVKTHRDNLDGIEIHAHSGGFDVNHTSNSSGRNSLQKIGAKHLGTIYKEEVDLEEAKKKKKTGDDFKPTAVEVKMKDDSQQLGANNAHGFDAFFNEEEEKEYSEQDLDKMIDDMSDDDIMDAYEDHELAVVDDETGEEIEQHEDENNPDLKVKITEVLSRTERIRARVRFAKTKSKRERGVKLALRRTSSSQTINKRARRLAINLFKKRMLRGRPMSSVGVAEKERIEKIIQKRKDVLNRVAMKLTSRVRQIEKARLHHHKFTNGGNGMNQV